MAKPGQTGEIVIKRGGKKHAHDEHGGAWKVAFADFCLALMCLFLVMWVLAARDKEETLQACIPNPSGSHMHTETGDKLIGEHQPGSLIPKERIFDSQTNAQTSTSKTLDSPEDLKKLSRTLHTMASDVGMGENVETMVTAQGLRVLIHDTDDEGIFEVGSPQPSRKFSQLLQKIAPLFQQINNQMLVVGHTDGRRFAAADPRGASNWSLSSARANSARGQLLLGGMPSKSVLQVIGMADSALLNPANPLAASNRRVELFVMTEAHARLIAAANGAPPEGEPLSKGVSIAPAVTEPLKALRSMLLGGPNPSPTTEQPAPADSGKVQ